MRPDTRAAPLRILHCPEMVAGNAQQLARAERELGLRSRSIVFHGHRFGYQADEVLSHTDMPSFLEHQATRARLFLRAVREADVVHLNFGQTILLGDSLLLSQNGRRHWTRRAVYGAARPVLRGLMYRDLQLLRAMGKGIAVTFQGDDARQGGYCREHFAVNATDEAGYYTPETDALKRRRIAAFGRWAHRIYALNPDLLHVLPSNAEFLPYSQIDLRDWSVVRREPNPVPVVVHAPSHQGVKGTRFILAAVERLKAEGVAFEFRLIEGMTHAQARAEYERADLLVDQLLLGWYGGLAVELMALGKPAICYVREEDLKFLPARMRADLPLLNATPDSIYTVLRTWLTERRHELPAAGTRSRAYVERWHDPLTIARRLADDYAAMTGWSARS